MVLLSYGLESLLGTRVKTLGQNILVAYAVILNFLGNFCKAIPFYSGFFIPRFHLRHFFEIYSPANFRLVLENLSINKPAFITPSVVGILILCYVFLVARALWLFFRRRDTEISRR